MNYKTLLYAAVTGLFLSSCSPKVPYTSYLATKYQLTEADLKKVQFYTSEDIILSTKESSSKTETENGNIVVSSNTAEDQIIIKKGTPGILEKQVGTDKVYISFEVGEGKFLVFGSTGQREPFRLQAENWNEGKGKLTYGGKTYYASGYSGTAHLLVYIKKFQKKKSNQKVVEGRKVQ
jgi:hypothetical protein